MNNFIIDKGSHNTIAHNPEDLLMLTDPQDLESIRAEVQHILDRAREDNPNTILGMGEEELQQVFWKCLSHKIVQTCQQSRLFNCTLMAQRNPDGSHRSLTQTGNMASFFSSLLCDRSAEGNEDDELGLDPRLVDSNDNCTHSATCLMTSLQKQHLFEAQPGERLLQ
jgi:hypothetical protein